MPVNQISIILKYCCTRKSLRRYNKNYLRDSDDRYRFVTTVDMWYRVESNKIEIVA
jgi:hypothetical protein